MGVNPDPTKFSFFIAKGLSDSGSGAGKNIDTTIYFAVLLLDD